MRKIICKSCTFNTTEGERQWNKAISNGRCPKCASPIKILEANNPLQIEASGQYESNSNISVIITDINIPFFSMVILMVKLAIAAIPASIVVLLIYVCYVVLATKFFLVLN